VVLIDDPTIGGPVIRILSDNASIQGINLEGGERAI
jgi:hypothetical protein